MNRDLRLLALHPLSFPLPRGPILVPVPPLSFKDGHIKEFDR